MSVYSFNSWVGEDNNEILTWFLNKAIYISQLGKEFLSNTVLTFRKRKKLDSTVTHTLSLLIGSRSF